MAAFFGTLIAGGTPSPVIFRSADEYLSQLTRQLQAASPCLVVSDADLLPVMVEAAQAAGLDCPCLRLPLAGERCELPARAPAGLALLQFTAGAPAGAHGGSGSPGATWRHTSRRCTNGSAGARTTASPAGFRSTTTWA